MKEKRYFLAKHVLEFRLEFLCLFLFKLCSLIEYFQSDFEFFFFLMLVAEIVEENFFFLLFELDFSIYFLFFLLIVT